MTYGERRKAIECLAFASDYIHQDTIEHRSERVEQLLADMSDCIHIMEKEEDEQREFFLSLVPKEKQA